MSQEFEDEEELQRAVEVKIYSSATVKLLFYSCLVLGMLA